MHIARVSPDEALECPAESSVEQDVGAPQATREEREGDAKAVEPTRGAAGQREDAGDREHDPQAVGSTSGAHDCDRQRAHELDRHRDSQWDPVESLVEAQVHGRQHDPERAREEQLLACAPAQAWSPDQQQDDCRRGQAKEYRVARSELPEQGCGERRAELHRGDRADHQAP
jgi:hypothetical protein